MAGKGMNTLTGMSKPESESVSMKAHLVALSVLDAEIDRLRTGLMAIHQGLIEAPPTMASAIAMQSDLAGIVLDGNPIPSWVDLDYLKPHSKER